MNDGWIFSEGFEPRFRYELQPGKPVRLPHNAVNLPLNYFDERVYQKEFCYQRILHWQELASGESQLIFDAAMADARVFLNGIEIQHHRDGFTPFTARLTEHLQPGENLLSVRIDGRENPSIPPFGGYIDYLTYAGIYRDVWLQTTGSAWIGDIKIETPNPLGQRKSVRVKCGFHGKGYMGCRLRVSIQDRSSKTVTSSECAISGAQVQLTLDDLTGIELWDIDNPVLYRAEVSLLAETALDHREISFGFRDAVFAADGFRLNGRLLKIRGLNRHQSFPYVGYAMGRRSQERDASILKHELGCNLVRTSHYPQSSWFLDHCDRVGLLVFEEIPGWQHIGGREWQQESVRNVARMIRRDWNHPSIVLWGVRINESADNREFYTRTNRLARKLDSTRQTSGVRCIGNSELLEDVYAMNDFAIGSEEMPGANHHRVALRGQTEVTGLSGNVPYLVTEFNGHMFPTKSFDNEMRQAEHVLRFLQVLDASYGDPNITGSVGWCMFDYNTHREFGSGDRICHHGVLDMFRVEKFAAAVYASQSEVKSKPVLKPVTHWSRGERNIGGVLPLIILTNCDEVELKVGSYEGRRFLPDRVSFPHLPHPPVIIRPEDVNAGEFGTWGHSWEGMRLIGYQSGEPVTETRMVNSPIPAKLDVAADSGEILAGEKDEVRIVVTALSQTGSTLPYLTDPLNIEISGEAALIGPDSLAFRAGTAAFWIESTGRVGPVTVRIVSPRFLPASLSLSAVDRLCRSAPVRSAADAV